MQKKEYPKLLSLIVPVYKQELTIRKNIQDLLAELSKLDCNFEIIIVIDGKIDKSFEEAKKIRSNYVHVVGYKTNHGKGYAVRYGMSQSKGDVIGFIDAGGDIAIHGLSIMLELFRWYSADIIIGSKRHPLSKIYYPLSRKILSFVYQIMVKLLFGLRIRDSQVGLKLYKREILEDVLPRLLVKKFAFDIEILAVAYRLGYTKIYESPIELDFRGLSSITSTNFWKVIYITTVDTLAIFYRLKILRYYDTNNKNKWKFDPELNFNINLP